MIKKLIKYGKIAMAMCLIMALALPSYATVGASDGSAFVTKAEFDAALSDFNARLTTFEAGINSKIDSQVSSYLDRNGIWQGKEQTINTWGGDGSDTLTWDFLLDTNLRSCDEDCSYDLKLTDASAGSASVQTWQPAHQAIPQAFKEMQREANCRCCRTNTNGVKYSMKDAGWTTEIVPRVSGTIQIGEPLKFINTINKTGLLYLDFEVINADSTGRYSWMLSNYNYTDGEGNSNYDFQDSSRFPASVTLNISTKLGSVADWDLLSTKNSYQNYAQATVQVLDFQKMTRYDHMVNSTTWVTAGPKNPEDKNVWGWWKIGSKPQKNPLLFFVKKGDSVFIADELNWSWGYQAESKFMSTNQWMMWSALASQNTQHFGIGYRATAKVY